MTEIETVELKQCFKITASGDDIESMHLQEITKTPVIVFDLVNVVVVVTFRSAVSFPR